MPKFFKKNGNGMIEMSVKIWTLVKIILGILGIIAVASFTYGSRSAKWDYGIKKNTTEITKLEKVDTELVEKNEEQDKNIEKIKGAVERIDERTISIKESIDEIKDVLKE